MITYTIKNVLHRNRKKERMVCFSRFVYNIAACNVENFLVCAARFFPGVEWKVSVDDTTIKSSDLSSAVQKLKAIVPNCTLFVFDTQRIWDELSASRSLPSPDWSKITVTQQQRDKYYKIVEILDSHLPKHDRGSPEVYWEQTLEGLDFKDILSIFKMVDESYEVSGIYVCPSTKQAYIRRKNFQVIRVSYKNGNFICTENVDFIFDFDDGFVGRNGKVLPQEFTEDWNNWNNNNQKGEVLTVRYDIN